MLYCQLAGLPPELYSIWESYPWRFGQPYCLFKTFLTEMTSSASVLTITAFTVERYVGHLLPTPGAGHIESDESGQGHRLHLGDSLSDRPTLSSSHEDLLPPGRSAHKRLYRRVPHLQHPDFLAASDAVRLPGIHLPPLHHSSARHQHLVHPHRTGTPAVECRCQGLAAVVGDRRRGQDEPSTTVEKVRPQDAR